MRAFSPMFGALLRNSKFNIIELETKEEKKKNDANIHKKWIKYFTQHNSERQSEKKGTTTAATAAAASSADQYYYQPNPATTITIANPIIYEDANKEVQTSGPITIYFVLGIRKPTGKSAFAAILKYGIFFSWPEPNAVCCTVHTYTMTHLLAQRACSCCGSFLGPGIFHVHA